MHTTTPATIRLEVRGTPAPQGSKTARPVRTKTGRIIINQVESSKKVAPWRARIVAACLTARIRPIAGPVELTVEFRLTRPAAHYGTGRNAGALRPSAPTAPGVFPDLDKLLRSTCDGLTAGRAWEDDSRVVRIQASKVYVNPGGLPEGATIEVREAHG